MKTIIRIVISILAAYSLLGASATAAAEPSAELSAFYLQRLCLLESKIAHLSTRNDGQGTEQRICFLKRQMNLLEQSLSSDDRRAWSAQYRAGNSRRFARVYINRLVAQKAEKYTVDPKLAQAVLWAESDYDVYALSPKGAMGLMQLMPQTARELGVRNPWDPEQNIEGGVKYLALLLQEFGTVRETLVAYNAGPERVRKNKKMFRETRVYVQRILAYMREQDV